MLNAESDFSTLLRGYSLTTAEILYHLPDHPALLQSYIWQDYDLHPRFPKLSGFLEFWATRLDGKLYKAGAADGVLRWAFATDGAALESGAFGYDRRTIQSSPSVGDGIAYVGSRDGTLYAVDAQRGTLRWRFDNSVFWSNVTCAAG